MVTFTTLPAEIQCTIASRLPPGSIPAFRAICRQSQQASFTLFVALFATLEVLLSVKSLERAKNIVGHRDLRPFVRAIRISGTTAPDRDRAVFLVPLVAMLKFLPNLALTVSERIPSRGTISFARMPPATSIHLLIAALIGSGALPPVLKLRGFAPKLLWMSEDLLQTLPGAFTHLSELCLEIDPFYPSSMIRGMCLDIFLNATCRIRSLDLTIPYDFYDVTSLDETIKAWKEVLSIRYGRLEKLRLKNVVGDEEVVYKFIEPSLSTLISLDIEITSNLKSAEGMTVFWTQKMTEITMGPTCMKYARISFPCDSDDDVVARRDTITWSGIDKTINVKSWIHKFENAVAVISPQE